MRKSNVAVVTGASRGIGAAVARRLARDGADVVVNYSANEVAASSVVEEIRGMGRRAIAVRANVSEIEGIKLLFARVAAEFDRIDVLVNNAATFEVCAMQDVQPTAFNKLFDLNARSVFFASEEAARLMGKGGRIINISSDLSCMSMHGTSLYAGAKAAIEAFTRVHAAELGPRGITVNAVSPGIVDTDALRANMPDQMIQGIVSMTPLGRVGAPEDVADVVAFIASDDSRWITGQVLHVNGGVLMR
ncbi:SDR family oxidoreductase [Sorangium sp. So ce124]|uniref:SDR family oxidoreductase n=1 Tax=Sorangium sp. So ce124 TaxID=3133280 RepID=UPI003F62D076